MIAGTVCKLIFRVVLDEAHGHVLILGAGGTLTELLQDSTSMLIPAISAQIKSALEGLKIAKLLQGYRVNPAADIDTIVDAALAVQDYVIQNQGTISEVEVNPQLCLPNGSIVVDTLILIGDPDD